jgi:ParB family chromosome partitioning protein
MNKPTTRLGRGLSALLSPRTGALPEVAEQPPHAGVSLIPIEQIRPNPNQSRRSFDPGSIARLADSIRSAGVLQPVIVRPSPDGEGYELVAGERRWRAARQAGLERIPALIKDASDSSAFEAALIENIQREDLNPIDRAKAYRNYLDVFGGTIESLATKVGESRANISNYLRLLDLDPEVQKLVFEGQLSMGHARAIASIGDPRRRLAVAKMVIRRNLSVRQTEALAAREQDPRQSTAVGVSDDGREGYRRHVDAVEQALAAALGLRVRIQAGRSGKSGKVVIFFSNPEEFERILQKICGRRSLE